MSATLGDVLNRGRVDAFVTNISEAGYLFHGNNLRLNFLPELGRFQQAAEGVVADAGWAWGAQLGDLDNDGRNELFIVNGYVSGDRDRSYWYAASKIAGAYGPVFEDARSWPAIGTASLSGAERQLQIVHGGVGFASQNDRRLHFGLGRTGRADRVMIRWPSGTRQTIEHPAVDQLHIVTEPRPDA